VRLLVLLLSSLLLAACTNMVRSQTPWFGAADAAGAPSLRDGVWAAAASDCRFDASRPLEQWPDCAHGRVIRGGEELGLNSSGSVDEHGRLVQADYDWSSEAFVLAAGDPRIHQSACGAPRSGKPEKAADAAATALDEGAAPATAAPGPTEASAVDEAVSRLVYCYAGLRADVLDAEGRIVAFTTWPIWCGPFPRRAEGESGPNVTETPFPGLSIVGEHCVADDVAALRAAATASQTLLASGHPLGPARFRWVRDGWR
jgi:hypothetical protein